jgi:HD-like signal output (HDOD) protein
MTAQQQQTVTREQAVNNAIREISHIATLPEITLRIIELVESPNSTAQDLNKVISNDPALCSRILKVVNSAFYGLPGQIGSINRAIVLLGLNAVKNIAIAASLAKLFRGGSLTPEFSAKDLWAHSIATATASKMICDHLKLAFADEAFLAGLIHDLGIIVEIQADRHRIIDVVGRVKPDENGAPTADMLEIETEIYGANHQDFGQGLCEKWKFPKNFAHVCGYHHRPLELAKDIRTLVSIIHIADKLAGGLPHGFRMDNQNLDIAPEILEDLNLSTDALKAINDKLPEQLQAVSAMLS